VKCLCSIYPPPQNTDSKRIIHSNHSRKQAAESKSTLTLTSALNLHGVTENQRAKI